MKTHTHTAYHFGHYDSRGGGWLVGAETLHEALLVVHAHYEDRFGGSDVDDPAWVWRWTESAYQAEPRWHCLFVGGRPDRDEELLVDYGGVYETSLLATQNGQRLGLVFTHKDTPEDERPTAEEAWALLRETYGLWHHESWTVQYDPEESPDYWGEDAWGLEWLC